MSEFLYGELQSVVCGDLLGEGSARKVYVCKLNSDHVVKVETRGGSFQNVSEWETWSWVQGSQMARWFAPCEFISNCGSILIQKRVEPIRLNERPPMLPAFLCDLKRENFGILGGKIVCCDYGTVPSAIRNASRRMVRVEWRT